jgi:hypothetical protein
MESRKQIGAEAATGEESKMRGEARVKAAASYPIVLRSYKNLKLNESLESRRQ